MKDSCVCGHTTYYLNGKAVSIYDIETGSEQTYYFDTVSDAINYYESIALPIIDDRE